MEGCIQSLKGIRAIAAQTCKNAMRNFGKLEIMTKLQVTGIIWPLFDQIGSFGIDFLAHHCTTDLPDPHVGSGAALPSPGHITTLRITQIKDTIHKRLNILAMRYDDILLTTDPGIVDGSEIAVILITFSGAKRDMLNGLTIETTSKDSEADNFLFTEIGIDTTREI